MKMKGAVDEARRKRLTRAGGRRTAQPKKSESAWAQAVAVLLGIWKVPLSNYGILVKWLWMKENQKVFARIKIDFVARKTLNRFSQEAPRILTIGLMLRPQSS